MVDFNTGIATAGLTYINSFLAYGNTPTSGNFMQKGKAWERNAHMEYFNDSLSILNKEIGIRIHGNQSRFYTKKSFRLYLKQDIDLFGDTSYVDTYTLKNPGSLPKNHIGHALLKNVSADIQKIKPLTM